MVYANDQWVQLPVRDLYDSNIMLAAINAAKDLYDTARLDYKDFRKEYGDFIAASPQDLAWYNNEFDIEGFVNDLYNQGQDPFRTKEGRLAVRKYINSRDLKTLGLVKKTAENAEIFNKNAAELLRKGLYNPVLAQLEGVSPNEWDTVKNKASFDRLSPTPIYDTATFSAPYFEGLKPTLRRVTKNGITYNTYSITEADLHDIADRHFNDLVNTPQGRLMYKMYKQQANNDPEVARKMFNEAIVSGNLRKRQYTDDYTQREAEQQKLSLERQKMALSREIAAMRANSRKDSKVKVGLNGLVMVDDEDKMTPWLTKVVMAHQLQYGRNVVGDARQGLGTFRNTIQGIIDGYSNAMHEEAKRAGVPGKKIVDAPAETRKYPVQDVDGRVVYVSEVEMTPEKSHTVYSSAKTQAYKDLSASRRKMQLLLHDIDIIEKGLPNQDQKNHRSAALAYQSAVKHLSKYIDPSGMPTAALEAELTKVDLQKIHNISSDKQLVDYANSWYKRRENRSNYDPNSITYLNYLGMLGASKDEVYIPELGRNARLISFDGVMYSPVHRINVSGAGSKMSDNSIMKMFSDWLSNSGLNGIMLNTKISSAEVSKQGSNNPVIEANAWATISPRQLEEFYATLPKRITKHYNKKQVITALGLRERLIPSKLTEDGDLGDDFNNTVYYDVPVTGAHNTLEILQGIEWNLGESKLYYGTSKTLNEDLENSALDLLMY